MNEVGKRSSVQREQQGTENRSLWNTRGQHGRRRGAGVDKNRLSSIKQVRRQEIKGGVTDAKVRTKPAKKKLVVNSVKSCRHVKQDKSRNLLFINGEREIVVNLQQCSLNRMKFTVS